MKRLSTWRLNSNSSAALTSRFVIAIGCNRFLTFHLEVLPTNNVDVDGYWTTFATWINKQRSTRVFARTNYQKKASGMSTTEPHRGHGTTATVSHQSILCSQMINTCSKSLMLLQLHCHVRQNYERLFIKFCTLYTIMTSFTVSFKNGSLVW